MDSFLDYSSLMKDQKENITAYFYLLRNEFKEIRELIRALINYKPFEIDVRHATLIQKALNIAIAVSYTRNFKNSRGFNFQKIINDEIINNFTEASINLHEKLIDARDQEFVHSDSNAHDIKFNEHTNTIYSRGVVRQLLDKEQLNMLLEMVSKIQSHIRIHLNELK